MYCVRTRSKHIKNSKERCLLKHKNASSNSFLRLCQDHLRTYFWWSLCVLYLLACQMSVTVATEVFVAVSMCDAFLELINSPVC